MSDDERIRQLEQQNHESLESIKRLREQIRVYSADVEVQLAVVRAGMQLLAGEPLIGGALRIREHLAFIIEATGPRRRFTVYIRTLYKEPLAI